MDGTRSQPGSKSGLGPWGDPHRTHTPAQTEAQVLTLVSSVASPSLRLTRDPLRGTAIGKPHFRPLGNNAVRVCVCVCVYVHLRTQVPLHVQWNLNSQFLGKSSFPSDDRNRLSFFGVLSLPG